MASSRRNSQEELHALGEAGNEVWRERFKAEFRRYPRINLSAFFTEDDDPQSQLDDKLVKSKAGQPPPKLILEILDNVGLLGGDELLVDPCWYQAFVYFEKLWDNRTGKYVDVFMYSAKDDGEEGLVDYTHRVVGAFLDEEVELIMSTMLRGFIPTS